MMINRKYPKMHFNFLVRTFCTACCFLKFLDFVSSEKSSVSDEHGHHAVLRGASVRVHCTPLKGPEPERSSFTWTDQEGREVIEARFTKHRDGDLEIVNAHIGDSGVYKCKVRDDKTSRMYEHKLIVYDQSGHKFVSTVSIETSRYSKEVILTALKDLLGSKVCRQELCNPGTVKVPSCSKTEESCEFSMPYEALNQIADGKCDEECVRTNMFDGLKQAEKTLESELIKLSDSPKSRIKAEMKTFDTKHLITCRAGFHLVKAHFKRCFPCLPGYYSEANKVECNLCAIGSYQESYGKKACDTCEKGKTTETMGAKSRDECIDKSSTGVLGNLKEGFLSLFSG